MQRVGCFADGNKASIIRNRLQGCCVAAVYAGAPPVFASDEALCLDCHEPAEDWEGLSSEAILAKTKDTSIRRHADSQ